MRRRAAFVAALAVVAIALVFVALGASRSSSGHSGDTPADSGSASDRFFAGYVGADGRVVRHDQGGDTVSEGQAYAMQIALAGADAARFETAWKWTKAHLQRDDGLLSWRWDGGHVADAQPAADADVDIAVALVRAAKDFNRPDYLDEARRIARAAADRETFSAGGRTFLAAGPWAVDQHIVNPSYLAPCDYGDLLAASGDARWQQLRDNSLSLLAETLSQGLPPDWIVVDAGGSVRPIAGPDDRNGPGRYGLDAARVPARLATCTDGRALAGELWSRIHALDGDGAGLAYSLDGHRLDGRSNPLGLVAAAVAAHSSGNDSDASRLLAEAERLQRDHATYYGAAWLALGEQILGDHTLVGTGRGIRLLSTGAPEQLPPSTTLPPITTPPVDPTTTVAPTTLPPPTTTTAAPPTTTTTAPPPTTTPTTSAAAPPPATSTPAAPPTTAVATTTPGSTVDTTPAPTGTDVTNTTAAADSTASTQAPRRTTNGAAADLTSPPSGLDELLPGQPSARAVTKTPEEGSRRRTGGITIGGFAGIGALGASLGLRERRVVRRRVSR